MFNLQRLLFERIETRILVGTVTFLLTMVLVGWIAINEGGRMQAFDRQYTARAIERGAALFMTNCSECHNVDGRGITGVAPGLNNPYLFGLDFLADFDAEAKTLNAELGADGTTEERKAEINARLAEIETERAAVVTQMQPAIDRGYNPETPLRLKYVGWESTLYNYIFTTMVHGRPTSISYWPRSMPAWSNLAGGPLREDQLGDITTFILNWDKGDEWSLEDLNAVQQFPRIPVDGALSAPAEGSVGQDTPSETLVAELANYTGDAANGEALYNGALGCAGCHTAGVIAPITAGTWTRVETERVADPLFAGYTAEQYVAESIIHPDVYIAPGFQNLMPMTFGASLTYQDLADLIAFLQTQG